MDKRNTWRRELIQLTFLSFVVTAQRFKTHQRILRNTENNYELFKYSPALLTNKERLNERGKAKPVFTWQVNTAIDPRSVTQCSIVKLFSKLGFVHIKVVYIYWKVYWILLKNTHTFYNLIINGFKEAALTKQP